MSIEVRILGTVDAVVDGQFLRLSGSKQRAVLAILALRANRTVSADDLIDGLWGDAPPASAAKNVQLYISRLRQALDSNGSGARIITHGRGYELQLPEDAVDAARFERLVDRARRHAERGITDGTAQEALELWRGAPLADVASEPFADTEIRRLEELHLRATELSIDSELAAGRNGEVIGTLEALLAAHPLNERFHAQRMLALYRAGRQADALAAYREATRTLIDQIGVEPGPELRRLEQAILEQDASLEPPAPKEELPPQLELGSPLLAGRERELRWLRRRWEEAEAGRSQVALISGRSGIGKTRLAAELAAELHGKGTVVRYASGTGAPEAAAQTVDSVGGTERPTLLVLDDADDASPTLLDSAIALVQVARDTPLLVLALHADEDGPPSLSALEQAGAAQRLTLRPLRADAIVEIAELYKPADLMAMPLETLMAESQGVPLLIHRAASAWAQEQTAERLEATVVRAASGRGGLRAVETQLAGNVADLQATRQRTRLYLASEPADPSATDVCPFRGLAPFASAHAEYFFGRESLVANLVARLAGSTLLAVVGPSGSGKSSVVRAGLLPALASGVLPGSERWRQVVMRPGAQPSEELRRALDRLAPGELNPNEPFAAVLDVLRPDERLVLAVDQLEEIFTACRDEDQRIAFCDALVTAAGDPDRRAVVVLAIRGDFYGRCAEHPALAAEMSANTVLVGPMRREELRRAIELPARTAGLRVEPRLISALVGEVADEPGGLPLLSTTLVELWERRDGRTLRQSTYEASGGVSGAVARLAERAYQGLSAPQRERARQVLLRLVDAEEPEPVRRRVPLSELEVGRDEDVAAALAGLTDSRLVTVDEGTVEVAHEALLSEWPRLRAWLEEDAEGRRLHQHLTHAAGAWNESERDPAELYRGARLASALDWADGHESELNQLEREFLDGSQAASEREAERQRRTNRRLRALLAGVGVLLTLAVVAGLIARSERQSARSAATVADAERLGAEALTEDRLDNALLLANAGAALDDSARTRSNLLSALLGSPAVLGVLEGTGDPVTSIALSPDGRTMALGDEDGTVTLIDTETQERTDAYQAAGSVWTLDFDPSGDSVALTASTSPDLLQGVLAVIDTSSGVVRTDVDLGPHPADPELPYFPTVAFAPNGRSVIVAYSVGDIDYSAPAALRRFDARSGDRLQTVARATTSFSHPLQSTPDGRLLVTSEETTFAIDAETLRAVRRYPVGGSGGAISPDGGTLAVEGSDGGVRLLDLGSGRTRTLVGGSDPDSGHGIGAFSPDGRTLTTSDADGNVVLWDVRQGREIEALSSRSGDERGHGGGFSGHVFSPDGGNLYTASADSTVIVWDVVGDRRLGRSFATGYDDDYFRQSYPPPFAISPDGQSLAVARLNGRVEVIDAETLRKTASFKAFGPPAVAIEYSPDGRRLAVGSVSGGVGLWDAASGKQLGPLLLAPRDPLLNSPHDVQTLAFGQGDVLAAAEVGGAVRAWDLSRRELLWAPVRLPLFVLGVTFSPDGSQLAIAFGASPAEASDGVEVLEVTSGERIARLPSEGKVRSVAFSPDGSLLAGGHVDGSAVIWATDGWEQVGQPLVMRSGLALAVAFSPDGRTLATSHDDGAVVLWDVESQQPIGAPLPGVSDAWVTARFTPDGRRLFAVSEEGQAIRWEVDPAAWRQRACAITGGGLTPEQWEEVVPEQDYIEVCPE